MRSQFIAVAALYLSCLAVPALAHDAKLEGSEWGIVGDTGEATRYISFAGSGRMFGFGGCNRITGTFEQDGHDLTISPLAETRMMCPPEVMQKEEEFLQLLAKVRSARADHTLLLLLDESGADLRTLLRRDAEQETP